MKKLTLLFSGFILLSVYWSCEPGQDDPFLTNEPRPNPQSQNPSPSTDNAHDPYYDNWNDTYNYEWKMIVLDVDSFTGDSSNVIFQNVLLGNTLPNGISTTNTTYFRMYPDSNKARIYLAHGLEGWTLWEAYGYYPIQWVFTYVKTPETLELEGFANMGLSNCELPQGATLVNRYYFKGVADKKTPDTYVGRYVWSESYETGSCIKIEGRMLALKE